MRSHDAHTCLTQATTTQPPGSPKRSHDAQHLPHAGHHYATPRVPLTQAQPRRPTLASRRPLICNHHAHCLSSQLCATTSLSHKPTISLHLPPQRHHLPKVARRHSAPAHAIWLNASKNVCKQRITTRDEVIARTHAPPRCSGSRAAGRDCGGEVECGACGCRVASSSPPPPPSTKAESWGRPGHA